MGEVKQREVDLAAGFGELDDIDVNPNTANWKIAQELDRRARAANTMTPKRLRFTSSSQMIRNVFSMQILLNTLLVAESGAELQDIIQSFGDGEESLKSFAKSAKVAGTTLKGAIRSGQKYMDGRAARVESKKASDEAARIKQQRATAAEQVTAAEQLPSPIFLLKDAVKMPAATHGSSFTESSFYECLPLLIKGLDGMEEWSTKTQSPIGAREFWRTIQKDDAVQGYWFLPGSGAKGT